MFGFCPNDKTTMSSYHALVSADCIYIVVQKWGNNINVFIMYNKASVATEKSNYHITVVQSHGKYLDVIDIVSIYQYNYHAYSHSRSCESQL